MSQCGLGLGGGRSLAGSHGVFLDAWGELLGIGVQAAGHHHIQVFVAIEDQEADLLLQLADTLRREISGWDEPLPLLLLIQHLLETALDELLLPQLLLHLPKTQAEKQQSQFVGPTKNQNF